MTDDRKPLFRFAVVSDMHAFVSPKNGADSLLDYTGRLPKPPNPLSDLIALAKEQSLRADFLVCAGDICNRADSGGLERAWADLHILREAFKAKRLIATCGNHDLDSRHLTEDPDPDPKGALLALNPSFPFDDPALSDRFWARNYAVVKDETGIVLVCLNTSAYHGGKEEELAYGRVSSRTISALANEIKDTGDAKAHVLICHHHPLPLQGGTYGPDSEYIKNGQHLLDELIRNTGKSWLIIHGHRHRPRLIHGASSHSAVPFVFGAGSLGARIPGVPNQFHIISLYSSSRSDDTSIVGTVETWSWTESSNWTPSYEKTGLPSMCGFGFRGRLDVLVKNITNLVGEHFASWESIQAQFPEVDFLMPDDLKVLEKDLSKNGINFHWNSNGRPIQVGK